VWNTSLHEAVQFAGDNRDKIFLQASEIKEADYSCKIYGSYWLSSDINILI